MARNSSKRGNIMVHIVWTSVTLDGAGTLDVAAFTANDNLHFRAVRQDYTTWRLYYVMDNDTLEVVANVRTGNFDLPNVKRQLARAAALVVREALSDEHTWAQEAAAS